MKTLEETSREHVLEEAAREPEAPLGARPPHPAWAAVCRAGTRLWLDTGGLDAASALWAAEFEALTTNNTLLNREVQKGQYDGLVRRAAEALRAAAPGELDEREQVREIAFVLNARHALRLVQRFDAFVSVELHTDVADDVERSVAYGLRYFAICPERFYVKVPLTPAGLVAARRLGEAGVPVNLTLGFSARQTLLAAAVAQPAFANVFMGRLGAFVADNGLGSGELVGERATRSAQQVLTDLRDRGATQTLLIGASMREPGQVAALAGLDVFTMPTGVAEGYAKAPAATVAPRVRDRSPVEFAAGHDARSTGADTLWDVPDGLAAAIEDLGQVEARDLSADAIRGRLAEAGCGGLLPDWTAEDRARAAADGKIPVFEAWRERLAGGDVGLDALMNLSGLLSFTADQRALDDRISGLLAS